MSREADRAEFMVLAAALREHRIKRGWTQGATAERTGVACSVLRRWEFGLAVPSAVNFISWCRVLGFFVEVTDVEAGSGA